MADVAVNSDNDSVVIEKAISELIGRSDEIQYDFSAAVKVLQNSLTETNKAS